jgi:hypothetical protein
MAFASKQQRALQPARVSSVAPCPGCGVELDGGATPVDSIVICAHCCTALIWDGTFCRLTAEQIEQLPEAARIRLHSIVEAQRARNAARALH